MFRYVFSFLPISPAVNVILTSLETEPKTWFFGKHYATHEITGIKIWIASGWTFLHLEETPNFLSFWEKYFIYSAVKKSYNLAMVEGLNKMRSR